MKKKQFMKILIAPVLLFFLLIVPIQESFAQEGAEVSTKGEITLFKEDASSKEEHKNSTSSLNSGIFKLKGRMPLTGEFVKNGLAIGGGLLIVTICLAYVLKRHCQKNRKES